MSATTELISLPNQDELPCDDRVSMKTWLEQRDDGFIGGNIFVYFSTEQLLNRAFKGPGFFAAPDVSKAEQRTAVELAKLKTQSKQNNQ